MRRRIWIASVSFVVLLLAGSAPVWADSPGRVTGAINLEPPDWGMYFRVWINFSIHQVDPSTGEAKGTIEARVHNPVFGTKRLWSGISPSV